MQREHCDHRGRDRPIGRHHDCGRRIQHLRLHPPRLVDGRPPLLRGRRRIGRAVERHQHPHVLLQRGGLEQPVPGVHLRGKQRSHRPQPLHQGRHRVPKQLPRRPAFVGRQQPDKPPRGGLHRHLPVEQLCGLQRHVVQLPLLCFRRGGGEPH